MKTGSCEIKVDLKFQLIIKIEDAEVFITNSLSNFSYVTINEEKNRELYSIITTKKIRELSFKCYTETEFPILIAKYIDLESNDKNECIREFILEKAMSKEDIKKALNERIETVTFKNNMNLLKSIDETYTNVNESLIKNENELSSSEKSLKDNFEKSKSALSSMIDELIDLNQNKKVLPKRIIDKIPDTVILAKEQENYDASVCKREITDFDIQYDHFEGEEYVCRGTINGCTNTTTYGSNPYTSDSNYCTAARHAGLIDETGGIFHVKKIGSLNLYNSSFQNGITTTQWNSAWDGLTFHKTYLMDYAHDKFDYCGKFVEK